MRWIKLAIISAIILFIVVFLISILIPGHIRISRAVNIRAPQQQVAAIVGNPETWATWNEPVKNAGSAGVQASANQIISGDLEIMYTMVTTDTVKTLWRTRQGREVMGVFSLQTGGDVTIVQWYFDFYLPWYPWEKFASINFDKQWGPVMERSLENLRELAEN